ncbi:MAG TPA: phosphatidate cytidylyltransferase [Thermoanaerobaculia bacterium]|nr:phosphatidate cytidylyltransferase [Thermoanaerobaculia bacterium]HUM30184.1 phosphatidate cytidylyltransferase [Thermoanaerobaculia bacterium]HXK68367.1 phosphatidate cytidylyltransferase [Thermoanaerobaculia bacterium]
MKRELTALVGIPVILAILILAPPWAFMGLAAAAASIALAEVCRIFQLRQKSYLVWLALPLAWMWMGGMVLNWPLLPLLLVQTLLPAIAVLLVSGDLEHRYQSHLMMTVLPLLIGIPASYLMRLRSEFGSSEGIKTILLLLVLVWVGDSAAYYVGKHFGKRKISPRVSPNKTVAGTLALVLTCLIVTMAWARMFEPRFFPYWAGLGGITVGLTAFFGDLSQSLWKRVFQVKDSGTFFPGHGGFWDRTDSLFWSAIPLFYLLTLS